MVFIDDHLFVKRFQILFRGHVKFDAVFHRQLDQFFHFCVGYFVLEGIKSGNLEFKIEQSNLMTNNSLSLLENSCTEQCVLDS